MRVEDPKTNKLKPSRCCGARLLQDGILIGTFVKNEMNWVMLLSGVASKDALKERG